jgi:hypothetical protein
MKLKPRRKDIKVWKATAKRIKKGKVDKRKGE